MSEDDDHAYFMSMLRSRFEVDYGEGKPIEFLLGMSIEQNLEAGTIRMSMEAPIVKLAHGILTPEEIAKCADVDIPMLPNAVLPRLKESEVSVATFDYLSVVGSLIHFATRYLFRRWSACPTWIVPWESTCPSGKAYSNVLV